MGRNARQRRSWIVDAVLFAGFVVSMVLDLTGVAAHEFLGAAVIALAGYHLLAHGQWVACTTRRLLGNLGAQCRRVYLVDAALLAGFVAIGVTGLAISSWLSLPLADYVAWRDAHVYASVVGLALLVLKVGLHWRWIASVATRDVFSPRSALVPVPAAEPVRTGARVGRRDFVRVMGIVGVASLAVGANVLTETGAGRAEAKAADAGSSTTAAPSPALQGISASATVAASTPVTVALAAPSAVSTTVTSACVVQCDRRCSYPGRCRRYVDAKSNGKCDLGECTA